MTYYYLLGGAFALVLLGVTFLVAWLVVRNWSRQEAADKAKKALGFTLAGTLIGAIAWVPLVNRGVEAASKNAVSDYCRDAREEIYRTVQDVDGLYVGNPQLRQGGEYHYGDTSAFAYLQKPDRLYRFLEVGGYGERSGIQRYDAGDNFLSPTRTSEIAARYAMTWIGLQSIEEGNRGIFGDLTLIYDRQTGEILARREFYYSVESISGPGSGRTRLHPCPNVRLPEDKSEPRFRKLDSYDFVSRVLVPPAMNAAETTAAYDIAPGRGHTEGLCSSGTKAAPGVMRDDIVATRFASDLRLALRGRDDLLVCKNFYLFMDEYADRAVLLADGTRIPYAKFANLHDLADDEFARLEALGDKQRKPAASQTREVAAAPAASAPTAQSAAMEFLERKRQEFLSRGEIEGARRIEEIMRQRRGSEANSSERAPTQVYRWVDKDGVVHYGDARDAPADAGQ